jgi:hypothetical protein
MRNLQASSLVPPGFVVESAEDDRDGVFLRVRSARASSPCPNCGTPSARVHSWYLRRLAELPMSGLRVRLVLLARRFRCEDAVCVRKIFAERFGADVLEPWSRRTGRLDQIVHCLALALGGRPAASFARRLMMPVSNDTLLRVVRRRGTTDGWSEPSRAWSPPSGAASSRTRPQCAPR